MAKIKSGEVKIEKGRDDQIKYDESKFFESLADLGIEFKQKNGKNEPTRNATQSVASGEENRYQERGEKNFANKSSSLIGKPSVFKAIKKVFTNQVPAKVTKENLALREVLNKINESTTTSLDESISLDSLKDKIKEEKKDSAPSKPVLPLAGRDRFASAEEMNKLKDLIAANMEVKKEEITPSASSGQAASAGATPPPQGGEESSKTQVKEVPEDVLRKILE